MKLTDIRGKDSRALRLDAEELRKELFKLRFRGASEEISDTARFKAIRRTIARINTILHERDTAANEAVGMERGNG